jgi:hypothetical protein
VNAMLCCVVVVPETPHLTVDDFLEHAVIFFPIA